MPNLKNLNLNLVFSKKLHFRFVIIMCRREPQTQIHASKENRAFSPRPPPTPFQENSHWINQGFSLPNVPVSSSLALHLIGLICLKRRTQQTKTGLNAKWCNEIRPLRAGSVTVCVYVLNKPHSRWMMGGWMSRCPVR